MKIRICAASIMLAAMFPAALHAANPDISGKVTCKGKGVAGVVVTDGIDCTTTAYDGTYSLEGKRGVRHVYISVPAGYKVDCADVTIPQFYQPFTTDKTVYDFELKKNPLDNGRHVFTVQADAQMTTEGEVAEYSDFLKDHDEFLKPYKGKVDVFGLDVGDIVGDSPQLYPLYIKATGQTGLPIYRAMGNHDMTHGGRTFEYSYSTFEDTFGPIYYSFNKGKAHYVMLDNVFYVNRDYQYIGYIDERTLAWLEQDLSYVPKDHVVFVMMHIPSSYEPKLKWNDLDSNLTSNVRGLFDLLEGRQAHLITGHTHFNHNVVFNDSLMEHNTAAVCGIWWKADICCDGTPRGFGFYEVNGTDVKWIFKSAGYPADYQMRVYPAGSDKEHPAEIIANVWNYDPQWKVEWLEDGKVMGEMQQYTGFDPETVRRCADREKMVYAWAKAEKTAHLFKARPVNPGAALEVRATDRFGNVYTQKIK